MQTSNISHFLQQVETQVNLVLTSLLSYEETKLKTHEEQIQSLDLELLKLDSEINETKKEIESLPLSSPDPDQEQERVSVLSRLLSKYESNLGLKILKVSPYTFDLIFSHITEYPSENRVRLHLSSSSLYTALECVPEIRDLSVHITSLNSSKDLSSFVKSLRSSFKSFYLS